MTGIRVVIADDHQLTRDGLRNLLTSRGFDVVGEASNGDDAVSTCLTVRPDVVVMDLHMPGTDGVEATRRILARAATTAVLVFEDDEWVVSALRAGARGYVLKGAARDDIVRAVEGVARGDAVFGPQVAGRVLDLASTQPPPSTAPFPELTDREREVLAMLAQGLDNSVIAQRLHLSRNTVRNHLSSVFAKLHVTDRSQAIVAARRAGIGD